MNKIFKNTFIYTLILIAIVSMNLHSQKKPSKSHILYLERQYQTLVNFAFQLLQIECPQIINTELYAHLGTNEGEQYPWTTGKIMEGVYQEDQEDIVYEHGGLFDGFSATVTHFWNADESDISKFVPPPYNSSFENAFQKAKLFLYGQDYWSHKTILMRKNNETITINGRQYPCWGKDIYYNSLIEFYQTGRYYLDNWRFLQTNGQIIRNNLNPPLELYKGTQERIDITYEILGRIAHLLTDMTIPAHAHNDSHPGGDTFDNEFCSNTYLNNYWSGFDALDRGGMIRVNQKSNPLRYLFYTANQIADRFKSDDVEGDCNINLNDGNDYYEEINYFYNVSPPTIGIGTYNGPEIAKYCIPTAIRTLAGLFHWFAIQTGQLNNYSLIRVPQDCSTIESAINSASNGQKIRICPGNYLLNNNIFLGTGITLQIDPGVTLNMNNKFINGSGTIIDLRTNHQNVIEVRSGRLLKGIFSKIEDALSNASIGQVIIINSGNYINTNNLYVSSGRTLSINSGAYLNFNPGISLVVNGILNANGATFQGNGVMGSWGGISIQSSGSSIYGCTIRDAQNGISCVGANPAVQWTRITNCNYGVNCSYGAAPAILPNNILTWNN